MAVIPSTISWAGPETKGFDSNGSLTEHVA